MHANQHPPSEWRNCYTQGRSIPQLQRPWDWSESESRFWTRKFVLHTSELATKTLIQVTSQGKFGFQFPVLFCSASDCQSKKCWKEVKTESRSQPSTNFHMTRFPSTTQNNPLVKISSVSLVTGPYLIKLQVQPTCVCVCRLCSSVKPSTCVIIV